MERSGTGSQGIGDGHGGHGTLTYLPHDGKPGTREIWAIYGRDDHAAKVGSYRYGGPLRPGRPGRVTGKLAKSGLVVRFGKARGRVLAYRVTVRIGHRTVRQVLDPGDRKLSIPLVSKGERVKVTVVALDQIRRAGPTRIVKLKA
jgi:hypothetical protein